MGQNQAIAIKPITEPAPAKNHFVRKVTSIRVVKVVLIATEAPPEAGEEFFDLVHHSPKMIRVPRVDWFASRRLLAYSCRRLEASLESETLAYRLAATRKKEVGEGLLCRRKTPSDQQRRYVIPMMR